MSDDSPLPAPPRWPLWIAGAATILWLLVTAAAMIPLIPGLRLPGSFDIVAVVAGITLSFAAPLALLWFVALRLQDSGRFRAERSALLAEQTRLTTLQLAQGADAISQLEQRLSDLTGQLTAMAKPVERQHQALAATITDLQQTSSGLLEAVQRTEVATATLGQETPAAAVKAEQLTVILAGSRDALATQMADAEGLLSRLAARLAEARAEATATADAAEARIMAITAATDTARIALAEPLGALNDGVDSALARTHQAVESARQGIGEQTVSLAATVSEALATTRNDLDAQSGVFLVAIESVLARAAEAMATTRETLDAQAEKIVTTVDNALIRTSDALGSTRDGVHAQTNAMLASVEQARTTIDNIGGESARAIAIRIAELTGGITDLGSNLDTQAERAARLAETLKAQIEGFDAALAASAEHGNATLTIVDSRLSAVHSSVSGLATPVAEAQSGLEKVIGHLATLDGAAGQFFEQLAEAVPAAVPGLEDLGSRLARLSDDAAALSTPIEASIDSLATAQSRLEVAGAALEDATAALNERLTSAETRLAAVTRGAEDEALVATAALLESFSRIRDVAAQSAGTMRETLSGVVAEAEAALDRAATAKAESAFGAPVRTALASLESQQNRAAAAAQAAAERISNRLVALTQTVTSVETHFDKRQTEVEIRERSDLARRATELLGSMKDQAIDLTRLLALDIEDQAYEDWLAGDRSRFLRGLALALDSDTGRAISRHLAHDAAFRVDAARFAQDFESLITHVTADRQGRALAGTLLASDPGKLYLALTQINSGDS